ncbi:cyclin-A2-like [Dendroctonus ponderosae]|uniref:Cyclin N-terminal domain-containing protein n=1 Tax=Dendroctonus ponderosae TaxID=77166 RepID=A0AAR5PM26_DENPD|nr:cyclin-A2 [Dendroctonus ponderosae]XP_048520929.1 cyclin-A2-like [Dendroctonus ponderosae]XP_048520939.1 cyclin-A2-like [Dendroctonus ponderosae]KAH0998720.1 hypothetical protein HUJ05_008660 [Dendroctonus ponderosae]KAH1016197.1 hypothetical protein HUJ04_007463 [Dendroctonus ponderosae]KAH1023671.1 hypothetical protein HUJ05_003282 [Dendroctonus ponderosae]KAH1023678.1 hypothetical protein HUJ05_003289 [Dendroctonus ponderosae]
MPKMTFKILEETENKPEEKHKKLVEVNGLVKRATQKHFIDNREVLQPICNGVNQGVKRKFSYEEKTLEEPRLRKTIKVVFEFPELSEDAVQSETCTAIQTGRQNEEVYSNDIWNYLLELEKSYQPLPNYMSKQPQLSWHIRSILVDWLASVMSAYTFRNETFHLSINYIDRFLSGASVIKSKFQLLGVAALLLATKIEEIHPIKLEDCVYLTDETFTTRQVKKMEQMIVKRLRFKMQPPTIDCLIEHFCKEHELDSKIQHFAKYIGELVLLEGDQYLNHLPSELAAASVALARFTICEEPSWPKKFKRHCGYSIKHLSPVVQKQQQSLVDSGRKQLNSIQKKYQSDKFHRVALLKPRNLILEDFQDEV